MVKFDVIYDVSLDLAVTYCRMNDEFNFNGKKDKLCCQW